MGFGVDANGCPIIPPPPQVTATPTATPSGPNPDPTRVCNMVVPNRVNLRQGPSLETEQLGYIDRSLGVLDVRDIINDGTDDWFQVDIGWVRGDLVRYAGTNCDQLRSVQSTEILIEPLTDEERGTLRAALIDADCAALFDYTVGLPTDTQVVLLQNPDTACHILNQYRDSRLVVEAVTIGYMDVLIRECPAQAVTFAQSIETLIQYDSDQANQISQVVAASLNPCQTVGDFLRGVLLFPTAPNGTAMLISGSLPQLIVGCLPEVTQNRINAIVDFITVNQIATAELQRDPCGVVRRASVLQASETVETEIYLALLTECQLTSIAALNRIVLFRAGYVLNGELCADINDDRLLTGIEMISDAPAQLQQCRPDIVNLFIKATANARNSFTLTQTERELILDSPDPCGAVTRYIRDGYIFVPIPLPVTPVPTTPASPVNPSPPTATLTPINIPIERRTAAPVVTIEAPSEGSSTDATPAAADSVANREAADIIYEVFADQYALVTVQQTDAETGNERAITLQIANNTVKPLETFQDVNASQYNPEYSAFNWLAYVGEDVAGVTSLVIRPGLRSMEEVTARLDTLTPDKTSRLAWAADGTIFLYAVMLDSAGMPGIYRVDLTDLQGAEVPALPLITNARNPLIIGTWIVYEDLSVTPSRLVYQRLARAGDEPIMISAQPLGIACGAASSYQQLVSEIVFICGDTLYRVRLGEDRPLESYSVDPSLGIISDISVPPNLRRFFFDNDQYGYQIAPDGSDQTPIEVAITSEGSVLRINWMTMR